MKITTEPLENRQLSLTIEVDEERTQEALQRAAREIAKQVDIPGFRRGKAPYTAIVQRFGEDAVRRQAADMLADEVYAEALEQEQIEPFAMADLEDVKLDPITFKLTVPLKPIVELGDYRSLRITPPTVDVSEEAVTEALEHMREDQAFFEPADRPAELGDGLAFTLVAKLADGTEVLNGNDLRTVLDANSADPAPGFHEAMVGAQAGDERVFSLTLGDNYPHEQHRGKEAEFTVKVTEVYDYILPKMDDDLARAVGNFASFEELRQEVESQLRQAEKNQSERLYADQALNSLVEQATIEYPPTMLKSELDSMVTEYEQAVKRETKLSLDDFLRIRNRTKEQLREDMTPQAVERLKRGLALSELARLEGLGLSNEEIKRGIDMMSAPWGSRAEQVRSALATSEDGRRAVTSRLMGSKAVERLAAIARGEAPPLDQEPESAEGVAVEAEAPAAESGEQA